VELLREDVLVLSGSEGDCWGRARNAAGSEVAERQGHQVKKGAEHHSELLVLGDSVLQIYHPLPTGIDIHKVPLHFLDSEAE
jgi:hypothetical protein